MVAALVRRLKTECCCRRRRGSARFINYTVAGSCVRGFVWACPSAVTLPREALVRPRAPGPVPLPTTFSNRLNESWGEAE